MSIFTGIFGKKKLNSPVDLSELQVDMHSHILPGIDDGAANLSVSKKMVEQLTGLGFRKLIATPHIMTDIYKNTPQTINKAKEALNEELVKENISTEITFAAEYMLDEALMDNIKQHDLLTMGKNFVLIELPYFNEPPNLLDVFFQLNLQGYRVILAHPERYVYWYDDFSKFEQLKDRDVYFQLNILTFGDMYALPTKKIIDNLVKHNMIEFIGTDIHDDQQIEILEKALYEPGLARLIESGNLMNHLL